MHEGGTGPENLQERGNLWFVDFTSRLRQQTDVSDHDPTLHETKHEGGLTLQSLKPGNNHTKDQLFLNEFPSGFVQH